MKGRSILATALLVLFIAIIGLTAWGVSYTNKPDFCNSCHIIEPFVDKWETSSMGQAGVTCVKCHFEPGIIGYGRGKVYSMMKLIEYGTGQQDVKPQSAELLTNSACLQEGCHQGVADSEHEAYLDPLDFPVVDTTNAANVVYFPHDFHVNEAQKKCAECHSGVVHGAELTGGKAQAKTDPEYCSTCHDGQTAPQLFGEIELSGREHPGIPKLDTGIWKNIHWRFAKGPGEYEGQQYDQIEKDTCLVCHDEPAEAKGCNRCHFIRPPEFSPTTETQEASAAPLAMFGMVIGVFLLTLVPYPKAKRFIFEGWLAVVLSVAVLATDVYAVYKVFEVVGSTTEGSREIEPVTLWISYLLLSASLLIFLFHQGVLKPRRRKLRRDGRD